MSCVPACNVHPVYVYMYYILLAGHCITHYILHHSRHSPALHDIVPTLDQPCSHAVRPLTPCSKHHGHQSGEWSRRCQFQHQEEKWNIGDGCTFGWWDDGPQGRHQRLAAPESCVHFITGLSYNKPTESFSPQRSARINCSSFNSRIAHGLSAIIALFRWLFKAFIYFTLGGITVLSLFRFGPGFPSLVIKNCTHGDCSRHFMTSLYCCIFGS